MFVKSLNIFTCFIRITISIPIFLKQFSSHLPTKCHMMGRSLLSFSFSNMLAWAVRGWGGSIFPISTPSITVGQLILELPDLLFLTLVSMAESLSGEIKTVVGVVAVSWVTLYSTNSGADIVGTKISSEMEVQVRAL